MDDTERARSLDAYRRAKWAELADEGPERLRRELARLETWLANANPDGEGWWGTRELEVDADWRRDRARVLREVLADWEERQA